jgi:hypothetical protein
MMATSKAGLACWEWRASLVSSNRLTPTAWRRGDTHLLVWPRSRSDTARRGEGEGGGEVDGSESCEVVSAVLEANRDFYDALRAGSLERLAQICCPGQASVIHPARSLITGWPAVSRSWEEIFAVVASSGTDDSDEDGEDGEDALSDDTRVEIYLMPDSVRANVPAGSGVAWVTAIEVFGSCENLPLPSQQLACLVSAFPRRSAACVLPRVP